MSISPERERVMDTALQMPVASMDVQSPETGEFNAATLARTGDAVISAAQDQPPKDSEVVLSDGRRWDEYSLWPQRVLGKSPVTESSDTAPQSTTTDGRPWTQYSTWNPRASL